ncbi:hypothetical protein GGR57DRAFT_210841 [Xylariaceae sp. FL1272]|nr:hypothetical protein GGR57DRAFT_210841 [Xylariaceae sp. FL1272]
MAASEQPSAPQSPVSPASDSPAASLPPPSPSDASSSPVEERDEKDGKHSVTPVPHMPNAFESLPDEIIQQILRLTDPDSFASLVLLNSKWRRISQQPFLYAHHLSHCPSYAMSHSVLPASAICDDNLPNLRRLFAREVKRNLFEAYLRPKQTNIKLISNSISSSSAPGGEGMQFSPSARGHHILAYNSSRIYLLDVRGSELAVKRELKILRRPAAACVVDDGSFLAVLSTDMQVDLYDMNETPPRRKQSLILDNSPRAIALSPCSSVLAAAYEGGIEVQSLNPGALATDRRAVKCDGVDALAFSFDGTQLLGTTTSSPTPNTVILTAPYYDPGSQIANDDLSALWTTSILFPNTSRDCSHAVLLQESNSMEATWTFTYDRSFETFRAVSIDDLRNGTTYFTGPIPAAASPGPVLPCTLPAANYKGELVSAGFEGKHIWLYGVPEDLEAVPELHHHADSAAQPTLGRRASGISVRSPSRRQESTGRRVPQWQVLCDKSRNSFISGRMIAELGGVSNVKWVSGFGRSSCEERLIIAARGIVPHRPITEEEGIDFVDGGRITILDFDFGLENGQEKEITIEVGTAEPEILEEEHRDMEAEVAIVRRRTVAQRRGNRGGGAMRSAPVMNPPADSMPPMPPIPRPPHPTDEDLEDPLIPRRMRTVHDSYQDTVPGAQEDVSLEEAQEALDAPYTHASPRSGTTLRRAATAAAANRQRNPPAPVAGPVEYRRADGRAEHPHESDADNWVPPPPPYVKDDPMVDLPSFLRHAPIPGAGVSRRTQTAAADIPPVPPLPAIPPVPSMPSTAQMHGSNRPELPKIHTGASTNALHHPQKTGLASVRMTSDPSAVQGPVSEDTQSTPQSGSSSSAYPRARVVQVDNDDIYDASPVGTPHPATRQGPIASTPDRPSASSQPSSNHFTHTTSSIPGDGATPSPARSYVPTVNTPSPHRGQKPQPRGTITETPVMGRLPNASTWPRAPDGPPVLQTSILNGYPHSAPATNLNNDQMIPSSLPRSAEPVPVMGLHSRQPSIGVSQPPPGGFQVPRVPVGSRSGNRDTRRFSSLPPLRAPSPPEQPLIISTPTGVNGAFDRNLAQGPVLHAPIPRHPRPIPGPGANQPTAQRLETMTGLSMREEPPVPMNHGIYNSPPPIPQSSYLRHHASVSRRPSRARRGALKNLQDARQRGWTGRKKKKDKENEQGGWTDVRRPEEQVPTGKDKDRKCVVM